MKNKIYLSVFFAFLIAGNAFSQTANWTVYNTANSQAPMGVMCIGIDKVNNKWFGTNYAGVFKYDGNSRTTFNKSNSPLPSNCIYSIAIDSLDHLWIGTAEGLVYFDGVNWTVWGTSSTPYSFGSVSSITIDNAGNVWCYSYFCNWPSLVKIQGSIMTSLNAGNSAIPVAYVEDIKVDEDNTIWLASFNKGLIKYDGISWTVFNPSNSGLTDSLTHCVAIGKNGDVWVGMQHGLAKFDGVNWTVYGSSQVNEITVDNNGVVWVAYDGNGVDKFDGTIWTHYSSYNSDLPENFIHDIKIDADNAVWIGTTREGIAVLKENATAINYLPGSFNGSVFPNPFTNQLNFELSNNEPATIVLYDFLSRQILQQAFTNSTTLNTEQFANGIYFYELRNEKGVVKKGKVIKQ